MPKIKAMAVLHKKEEKIQAVLGRLPKKYTDEQFVEMFIRLYSKDWGKIKSAYIKQSQDKEPGHIINMPKPEVYLRQILVNYLQNIDAPKAAETKEEVKVDAPAVERKAPAKKKEVAAEETIAEPKKAKAPVKKKTEVTDEDVVAAPKKVKAPAKKKEVAEETVAEVKKTKAPAKKKVVVEEEIVATEKKPKAAAKKPAAKK